MKANSNIKPVKIQDLGNGTYYVNYNIVELNGSFEWYYLLFKEYPTYDNIVVELVRLQYSINDEAAIIRKKLAGIDIDNEFDIQPNRFLLFVHFAIENQGKTAHHIIIHKSLD